MAFYARELPFCLPITELRCRRTVSQTW